MVKEKLTEKVVLMVEGGHEKLPQSSKQVDKVFLSELTSGRQKELLILQHQHTLECEERAKEQELELKSLRLNVCLR